MAARLDRRARRPAAVEPLERRTLFDAGATVTVVSSSLAELSVDEPLKGSAVVSVTNSGTVTLTSPYGIQIFASTVPLGVGSIDTASLPVGDVYVHSAIAPGQTVTYTIKGKLDYKGELKATTYQVYAEFRDSFLVGPDNEIGFYAASGAGPSLTVPPALITLSETQSISKLPATIAGGTATAAVDKVKVTNKGRDPSVGAVTVTVYLSADGTAADGTALQSVEASPHLGHGGSTVVTIPLGSIPAVSAGTYELVATALDPNQVTTSSAASAPIHVMTAGAAAPVAFSAALTQVAPQVGADPSTELVTLIRLSPALTFTNVSGAAVDEPVTLTYYFSLLPTFAVDSATKITSNTFTLRLAAKGKSSAKFKLTASVPLGHADEGLTDTPLYYSVVATDAAGNATTATYATPINFDL